MDKKSDKAKIPEIKELRKVCQTTEHPKYWRDRFLRSISIYFTRIFLILNLTPNQVTFMMLLMGVISALFYMKGEYAYSLIGLTLHHLHFIFDGCDGEVARFRKKGRKKWDEIRGIYLDSMTHFIVNPLLIMGMGIGAFFNNPTSLPDGVFLISGFFGAYGLLLINLSRIKKYEVFTKKGEFKILKGMNKQLWSQQNTWWRTEIEFLLSFELFNLMFIFTILDMLAYLVLFYAIVFPIFAIRRFYSGYKNIERI